jgi:hypothetical protein
MRFLTKPVRNLLLATVFGVAMGLVDTRVQAQEFQACFEALMECSMAQGDLVGDPNGQICWGEPDGYLVTPFDCMDGEEVLYSGWCYLHDPYGHPVYCEG